MATLGGEAIEKGRQLIDAAEAEYRFRRNGLIVSLAFMVCSRWDLPDPRIDLGGLPKASYFADIVVFDPAAIQDHASYDEPHQTGVTHVFVNGERFSSSRATPGRFVRGPGWGGNVDLIAE